MKQIIQRLKRLKDDERGVSPVVGFVLIFALIMIVFTLYQSSVVPAQNKEVEFTHSQTVEGQMSELNDAIKAASASGAPRSQTISTGMQYPNRAFGINPGPPIGTLQTKDQPDIELNGINVAGSAYWDGDMDSSEKFKNLKSFEYRIDYNGLQQNPVFTIDKGSLTKVYGDSPTLLVGGESNPIVSGRQINLYLLGGDYHESALTASPTVEPISTSTEYLQFESSGQSEIPIDSDLSKAECRDKWKRILGPGFSSTGTGHPYSFVKCQNSGHVMKLKPNTQFSIRITKIGFGDVDQSEPLEVVPTEVTTSQDTPTAELDTTVDEPTSFTVVVRDKYGNPVPNTDVRAESPDSSVNDNLQQMELATNDEGEATFTYTPESEGTKTINIELNGLNTPYDTATYEFHVTGDDDTGTPTPTP